MGFFHYKKEHLFSWFTRSEGQHVADTIGQVYLELSTFCNFSCETCMRGGIHDFRPRHFSLKAMDKLLPMLKNLPALKRIVLLGFGESMCNPHFEVILRKLRTIDASIIMVTNLSLFTSGTIALLSDLPVDEVWASWDDSLGQDNRVIRRGSDGTSFKNTIESLVAARDSSRRTGKVGMEVVASRMNLHFLPEIYTYAASIGIDECIVTNVFPYSENMQDEILYSKYDVAATPDLKKLLPWKARHLRVRFPSMVADRPRSCPFIERGTVFVTSSGEIAPCPELAYTHPAWYFGSKRIHKRCIFGSIHSKPIAEIWDGRDFSSFRENFTFFDYPDCTTCYDPDMCWHRSIQMIDCYGYSTPCGECLWAKKIVRCP